MLPQQIGLQLERRQALNHIGASSLIYAKHRLLVIASVLGSRLCSTVRTTAGLVEFFGELVGSVAAFGSQRCIDGLPDRARTGCGKLHVLCLRHLHPTSPELLRHANDRPLVHSIPVHGLSRKRCIDRTAFSSQDFVIFPGNFEKLTFLKFFNAFAKDCNEILAQIFGSWRQCGYLCGLCLTHEHVIPSQPGLQFFFRAPAKKQFAEASSTAPKQHAKTKARSLQKIMLAS